MTPAPLRSPEWLETLRARLAAAPSPPRWTAVASLPRLVIGGRVADEAEVAVLLSALPELSHLLSPGNRGLATPLCPPAWVEEFRRDAEPATRDAWVHALHERFHAAERPGSGRWVYVAVALLGGDRCALKVGAQVRQMAEDLNRVGANLGVELLKSIGTDTAIMQLDLLRRKVRRDSVRVRAEQAVDAIATQRGLTHDELADRIVPDCGLDAEGTRCFDFGPRRFQVLVGESLAPMIRDESGAVRKDLSAPRASDDPRMAAEAVAAWKLLKKSLKETFRLQADRLELAMVSGRSWSPDEFRRFFVEHPVMRHVARVLLWCSDDFARGFRIAEDRGLCDENDEPLAAAPGGRIRLLHPLHLDSAARGRWGQVFGDYGLLPPFPQIGRPVFTLEPGEAGALSLDRFKGRVVNALSLLGRLTRLGWRRDDPEEGGCIAQHRKTYDGGVTVILRHEDGIPIYDPRVAEPQTLDACVFFPADEASPSASGRLPLGEVPAVALSETIRDLTVITSGSEP